MPRFTTLHAPALDDLSRELRFAPPDAAERHAERAEALTAEIDPERDYPIDWIVFRLTGFRRESSSPALVKGRDLLADLPGLVERLTAVANRHAEDLRALGAVNRAELAARWGMSLKTLARCKRLGLIGRRALGPRGRPTLVFMPAAVSWFERAHPDAIARAESFTRLGPVFEARIVRRAARYRRRFGCSLNQTAARLAERFGRSHEALRQLLKRAARDHDDAPTYDEPAALDDRAGRVALRAVARGIDPAEIADRWGKPRRAVARAVLIARAQRLRSLVELGVVRPSVTLAPLDDSALSEPLSHESARTDLGEPGITDLALWIAAARIRTVVPGVVESARAAAYRALTHRAAVRILSVHPPAARAADLDAAETDLRWAALLKVELVRSQLPLLVQSLDGILGAPLDLLPAGLTTSSVRQLLRVSLTALADAVDQFNPLHAARTGTSRLAAPAGLAITRSATRWFKDHATPPLARPGPRPARAAARLIPGLTFEDWTRRVSPWQPWLWPDPRLRAALIRLDEPSRTLLNARYGWSGLPPATIAHLARTHSPHGTTIARMTTLERRAIRTATLAARALSPSPPGRGPG